jgi:hypothetical protein
MGVGDILDGTFKLLKADFKTLFLVGLIIIFPLRLAGAVGLGALVDSWIDDPNVENQFSAGAQVGGSLADLFIGLFILPILVACVARVVAGSYVGRETSRAEIWNRVVKRTPAIFATVLLSAAINIVLFAPVVLVIVLAVVGNSPELLILLVVLLPLSFAFYLFFVVRLYFAAVVLVAEDAGPIEAFKRSWALTRLSFWRLVLIGFLFSVMTSILSSVFTFPATFLSLAAGPLDWLVLGVGVSIGTVFAQLVTSVGTVLVYFDLRIRREAFDVQLLSSKLSPGL